MENKINIAEILRDMPKGTKLYSPLFGKCELVDTYTGEGDEPIRDILTLLPRAPISSAFPTIATSTF